MPEYVLNRNYTHRSLNGFTIDFKKGQPVFVPPMIEREVVAIGAARVDGDNPDVLEAEKPPVPQVSDEQRREELFASFDLLCEKNDSKDFTAQGVPSVKAVEKIVSFSVDKAEVLEAYGAYKIAKQED